MFAKIVNYTHIFTEDGATHHNLVLKASKSKCNVNDLAFYVIKGFCWIILHLYRDDKGLYQKWNEIHPLLFDNLMISTCNLVARSLDHSYQEMGKILCLFLLCTASVLHLHTKADILRLTSPNPETFQLFQLQRWTILMRKVTTMQEE